MHRCVLQCLLTGALIAGCRYIVRWLNFYTKYTQPGKYISKWCDYLTFEILFGSGVQPSLDFGLSGGKFFFDGLRVAEKFATVLGKENEASAWRQLGAKLAPVYATTFLHSDPAKPTQPGLFLRQTSYIGYATPCADWICWYDSSWNVVSALRPPSGDSSSSSGGPDATSEGVALQAIPETGLAPCITNSNTTCHWYLILLPDHSCIVSPDNGTAAFAKVATWRVVPGLSNATDVSFQSVAEPSLFISAAEASASSGDTPPGSRVLRALSLVEMGEDRLRATWSVEPPNILKQSPPVPLPPPGIAAGKYSGWHSFRSLENKTGHGSTPALASATIGNLSTLAGTRR